MSKPVTKARPGATPEPEQQELADFFGLLAARFAYERRDAASTASLPVVKRSPLRGTRVAKPGSRRTLVWLTSALVALLLVAAGTLPIWRRSVPLPDDVLGSWRTAATGYADRGFTLSPDTLVLKAGAGGQTVSSHSISRVSASQKGAETLYKIEYLVDGAAVEFPLRYTPGPPAEIHLAHQVEIAWTRSGK